MVKWHTTSGMRTNITRWTDICLLSGGLFIHTKLHSIMLALVNLSFTLFKAYWNMCYSTVAYSTKNVYAVVS